MCDGVSGEYTHSTVQSSTVLDSEKYANNFYFSGIRESLNEIELFLYFFFQVFLTFQLLLAMLALLYFLEAGRNVIRNLTHINR